MQRNQTSRSGSDFAACDSPASLSEAFAAFFNYPSPIVLGLFVVGAVVARAFLAPLGPFDAIAVVLPIAGWPFLEWFLHRYLLHLQPRYVGGHKLDFDFAKKHRIHHRQPWRPKHIFLPVYVHATMGPILIAAALWIAPWPGLAVSWMAGLAAMALVYEWTHFIVHSRIRPRSRFAQRVFHNHRMHHFRNEHYWYSFTVPHVDVALGTGPDDRDVPRSDTCRTLDYFGQGAVAGENSG